MSLIDAIKQKAKADVKTVVLPEGEETRTVHAAEIIAKEKIANVILLGNEAKIKEAGKGLDLSGVTIIDPETSPKLAEYAQPFYEMRKAQGMTEEKA